MMNSRGVTLITLTVMIVVILILASIAMNTGMSSVKEANDTKVVVEMNKLKEAVSERMTDNARNNSTYPLVGEKTKDAVELTKYAYCIDGMSKDELQEFVNTINSESIDYMRIVDCYDAAELGVSSVVNDHYYIVDYYNGKVYGLINMAKYEKEFNSNT